MSADILNDAYEEGQIAALSAVFDCPYTSGQGIYRFFSDGFVSEAKNQNNLPENTPMFLAGRVAFAKGISLEEIPEGEVYSGRWFSGWLSERDRQK